MAEAVLLSMGLQGAGGDARNVELLFPSILKGSGITPSGAEIKAEPGCFARHEGAGLPVKGTGRGAPAATSLMLLFLTAGVPHVLQAPSSPWGQYSKGPVSGTTLPSPSQLSPALLQSLLGATSELGPVPPSHTHPSVQPSASVCRRHASAPEAMAHQ